MRGAVATSNNLGGSMASYVKGSPEPRYFPLISFPEEENAFIRRYLANFRACVREGRYDPAEVPKRAFLTSGHKALPHFVAIHARFAR